MEIVLGRELRARILTTAADTDGRHDLVDATMPAGGATPLHVHHRFDERLWVLEGEVEVHAGTDVRTLHPGDFYAIPRDTPHMLRSPRGSRALNISSPAAFAELLVRVGAPATAAGGEPELDPELFARVAAELGDEILGPPGTLPS